MSTAITASAKGASYLILLQISSRAFTFLINQIILRYSTPERLGLSTQLELYVITVLYFARESVRVAVQRQASQPQVVVNLSYISILLGFPLSLGLGWAWLQRDLPAIPYVKEAVLVCGVAALVELLSEPAFVIAQQRLLYGIRASAETTATVLSCLVRLAVIVGSTRAGVDLGVNAFAAGQLAYAVTLLVMYGWSIEGVAKRETFSMVLTKLSDTKDAIFGYFSRSLSKLSLSLFLQNGFKYVLTQGDGLLIAALASLRDQGAYALASNYGGLIARMLFQPIEETSRNLFAQLCANPPTETQEKENTASKASKQRAATLLQDILKLYNIMSLLAFSIGPPLAPMLLRIVQPKWADTEASDVLAVYCYYIPLLAINGVTEAFVAATASNEDLHYQSLFMGVFFVGFASSAYYFLNVLQLGAMGLVWSNVVNMGLRILFNIRFVKGYFKSHGLDFSIESTLPNTLSIALSVGAAGILRTPNSITLSANKGFIGQLIQAATVSGLYALSLLVFERQYFIHCYQQLKPSTAPDRPDRSAPAKEKSEKVL